MLTKTETRVIFDKEKIGVNDLVLFKMKKRKGLFGAEDITRYGLVNEVHDTYITIRVTEKNAVINNYICDATDAANLQMVERAIELF